MKLMRRPVLLLAVLFMAHNAWALSHAEPAAEISGKQGRSPADKSALSKQEGLQAPKGLAGELFGVDVPMENYYFVKGVIQVFGNRWGKPPKNADEFNEAIWEQLLLSFVAFSQNINVTKEDLEAEISKMLNEDKARFDPHKDTAAYEKWVKQKSGEPVELFENQLRHLIQLQKLRDQVMEAIKPEVFDKGALQKFSDEHNRLNLELVRFDKQEAADEFYRKAAGKTGFWEKAKKKNPEGFGQSGFVSLEFLVNTWKLPREAAHKMMQREAGDIYPPRSLDKGFGVFKILEKKFADESQFPQAKEPYYVDLIRRKKYEGLNDWLRQLKEQAKIKVYHKEGGKA